MTEGNFSAPAWLFSFVDLAFLMLIAMTQIGNSHGVDFDFGEIHVPRIHSQDSVALEHHSRSRWQLRVYPRIERDDRPYELSLSGPESAQGAAPSSSAPARLGRAELHTQTPEHET